MSLMFWATNKFDYLCRQTGYEVDGYCSENVVVQHDLLRDLIIHQTNQEPVVHRKRLIIEITGNDFSMWSTVGKHQPIHARLLSISTGLFKLLFLLIFWKNQYVLALNYRFLLKWQWQKNIFRWKFLLGLVWLDTSCSWGCSTELLFKSLHHTALYW